MDRSQNILENSDPKPGNPTTSCVAISSEGLDQLKDQRAPLIFTRTLTFTSGPTRQRQICPPPEPIGCPCLLCQRVSNQGTPRDFLLSSIKLLAPGLTNSDYRQGLFCYIKNKYLSLWKTREVPQKVKNRTTLRRRNCTTRNLSEGYRSTNLKGHMHPQCL